MVTGKMDSVDTLAKKPERASIGRFLALALVLHLGLVLIPIVKNVTPSRIPTLDVRLIQNPSILIQPETAPAPIAPEPTPQPRRDTTDDMSRDEPPPGSTNPPTSEPVAEAFNDPPETPSTPNRQQIIESLKGLKLNPQPAAKPRYGRATESEHYRAMSKPILPLGQTLFSDYQLPSETEIIDRWQNPDGTQQVVLRAPNGLTLCGRQQPVDPFRPWTQMPMLFHPCAGGGKRR